MLALLCVAATPAASLTADPDGPPLVVGRSALSAEPLALSVGPAGPFNRWAFDVERFDPADPAASVTCRYGPAFLYRCAAVIDGAEGAAGRRRVTVTIPDLGRGPEVTVRFATSRGLHEVVLEIANVPQVVHEIETFPLPGGGQVVTGGDGRPRPAAQLARVRATTTPALATSALAAAPSCDGLYALWVRATATDAVFTGPLGALAGTLTVSRPVIAGSRVTTDSLPEWLATFPLGADRVQFIAHYEVLYRVGACAARRVNEPSADAAVPVPPTRRASRAAA